MILLATSPTIQGIESIINKYFFSTSFQVKPTSNNKIFEVHNSKGLVKNFNVTIKSNKYRFNQLPA